MRTRAKAAMVVMVLTMLVFLPSVSGAFVYDDIPLIAENEYVHSWQHVGRAFRTHFWDITLYEDAAEMRGSAGQRQYYRPIVTVTYLANWVLGGGKAWAFHLVNTLLHALAAWLAVRAATRWTRSVRLGLVCGLVFALHPSRTESVTWIAGRTDVVMLLFVLASLEAFHAYRRRPRWWLAGAGIAALAGAILSKEPGAMLALLALADRDVTSASVRASRRSWTVPAITIAIGATYLVGRMLFWAPEGSVSRQFTPHHFLVTVGAYVERSIVPWPPTMYHHVLETRPDGTIIYSLGLTVLGIATLAASAYAAVVAWRRARAGFWLLVAAYAFMGPLLNIYFMVPDATAQDRFLYAPLFFAVSAIAVVLREPLSRLARRRATGFVLGGVTLAAILVIEIRTLDYRSNEAFWLAEVTQNPEHPYPLENLGIEAAARGDLPAAYAFFTRAEDPATLRFAFTGAEKRTLKAHFLRAVMLAGMMPDGRGEELAMLVDELWRLEEPGFVPAPGTVREYEIGKPLRLPEAVRIPLEKAFQWDIALVASRIGDDRRTKLVVDRASVKHLHVSSSPLNGALALARIGRLDEADAVRRTLVERRRDGRSAPSEEELTSFGNQLAGARSAKNAVLRLASLGAFLAALRQLEADGALESADAAPLVAQLLVACRLEDGARAHVGKHLGEARAKAVVDELVAQLPENLRLMAPVEKRTKEELLDGVRRRTTK